MLQHNFTIALRNLWKYKLQTTISIVSIAIGIVALATVHSVLHRHLRPAAITAMPYYDRVCTLCADSLLAHPHADGFGVRMNGDVVRALTDDGGLRCIEMGPTMGCQFSLNSHSVTYTLGDTLVFKYPTRSSSASATFPHFAGYRSAITGERLAVMRRNECIISESLAKNVFGKVNPVGAHAQFIVGNGITLSLTIADVYQDLSQMEELLSQDPKGLLFVTTEAADYDVWYNHAYKTHVVLRPECTLEQLEAEANERLKPFGLKARVSFLKDTVNKGAGLVMRIHFFAYLLGSLILLAAGIGFLRMQTQLLWMRKREISLRIVHGAKRGQLFVLLMTEVGMVVLCAVALALVFGNWLEQFLTPSVRISLNGSNDYVFVSDLVQYGAVIGLVALVLCAAIVWVTLRRICNNAYGLAAAMRGSRNHAFRNVMLWVQVFVSMLFMCATFVITVITEKYMAHWVMPDDDTRYRESIVMDISMSENREQLLAELAKLPDAARLIPFREGMCSFDEISADSLKQQLHRHVLEFWHVEIKDTALLDFYQVRVSWQKPGLKQGPCILINETLYPTLERCGVLARGVLTTQGFLSLPVVGTFQTMLFDNTDGETMCRDFIIILPDMPNTEAYIIESRRGRYDELWNSVHSTIARVEPTVVSPMAVNLYGVKAGYVKIMERVRKGAWLLGAVALLVCVMGIYSTIALDTRARRKEMAIRKINGAKARDIAGIFARLYVILLALALVPIIPLAVLLQRIFNDADERVLDFSLTFPVAAGCLMVIVTIALIVGWHVYGIMRVNPASIIAKE